jgi:hypothetical protein
MARISLKILELLKSVMKSTEGITQPLRRIECGTKRFL